MSMLQLPILLIIVHSRTGGSQAMANAFGEGARCEDAVQVAIRQAAACEPHEIREAAALAFAGPENLGSLSGQMKELLDRCYYPLFHCMQGKRYAHLICAGSDGQGAARQLARILTGWRMVPVAEPLLVCTGAQTREAIEARKLLSGADLRRCFDLGQLLAAGLAIGIF